MHHRNCEPWKYGEKQTCRYCRQDVSAGRGVCDNCGNQHAFECEFCGELMAKVEKITAPLRAVMLSSEPEYIPVLVKVSPMGWAPVDSEVVEILKLMEMVGDGSAFVGQLDRQNICLVTKIGTLDSITIMLSPPSQSGASGTPQ